MFIVSHDRKSIVNIDNIIEIYFDHKDVLASAGDHVFYLGTYQNEMRAKEVFDKISKDFFPTGASLEKHRY